MKLQAYNKTLLQRLFILAAPMALQNVISFSVGLTDNLMVGSLGEVALSGVYVANQLQNLLNMLVIGLSSAMLVLASQYWGKRDGVKVRALINITLSLGLLVTGLLFATTLLIPEQILRLFTNDATVIPESMTYFSVIRFSYLFYCLTQVLMSSMRCVEHVKIGMYLSMFTFSTNVFLNWVLIFGNLGMPAMGIRGAAIATLTVRIIESVIMVVFVRFIDKRLLYRFKTIFTYDFELLKHYFRYGFPVILGDIFWGINLSVQGAIIGHMGAMVTAAASISMIIFQMVGVVIYGTAGATAIIIGQTVGTGNVDLVKKYAKSLQIIYLVIGAITGLVFFLIRDPVLMLYNLSPESEHLARRMMGVLSVIIVGTSYQMSTLTGIVRAGGATKFVLV